MSLIKNSFYRTKSYLSFDRLIQLIPNFLLVRIAEFFSEVRPEGPYPGWRFAEEEYKPTIKVNRRLAIWREFVRRDYLALPVKIKWYEGLNIYLRLGNDQSRCLYVSGSFEPNEIYWLGTILKSGMCFLDIGANEGFYTTYAAKKVGPTGSVYAFEPSVRELTWLQRNIDRNNLQNVTVFQMGLADKKGKAVLKIADHEHNGQNTLGATFGHPGVSSISEIEVPITTIDAMRHAKLLPKLDVVKIDVEGAEAMVLEGAKATLVNDRPTIIIELFEAALALQGSCVAEVINFLEGANYRILWFNNVSGRLTDIRPSDVSSQNVVAVP